MQVLLDNPFGKETKTQSFTTDVLFCHVLVFIVKLGYTTVDDRNTLGYAYPLARRLFKILRTLKNTDFRPLRGGIPPNITDAALMKQQQAMVTACFVHFNFDTASVIRYIGGQHTAAHRNVKKITAELRRAGIKEQLVNDLERIFTFGVPGICNAHSSEENFWAYLKYGNHKTVYEDIAQTTSTIMKEVCKGFALTADAELTWFLTNLHLTPTGLINLSHPYKSPRLIFDSSFQPFPWCFAINDMTSKHTEPEIHFPKTWILFLTWIWNLRITYPRLEIYLCDDDVSGAFRHVKYNPNVVALHAFLLFGALFFFMGQTFGDTTSPANWEPVARCCQHYAQFLWNQPDSVERAQPYLPKLQLAPDPTTNERASFVQATADTQHQGVLDPAGKRKPPTFNHHVDDCFYADIGNYVQLGVAASVLALYQILSHPTPQHGDPVSWDKFQATYSHRRKVTGFNINSRTLQVSLPDYKREHLQALLDKWLQRKTYTLLDAAELLGLLNNLSSICRWMRPRYFALQNAAR